MPVWPGRVKEKLLFIWLCSPISEQGRKGPFHLQWHSVTAKFYLYKGRRNVCAGLTQTQPILLFEEAKTEQWLCPCTLGSYDEKNC